MTFYKETSFEETSIGEFPKDWKTVMLGDIALVKGGKRLPKGEKLVDFDTGFPYIRVVDFKNGTVDVSSLKYLRPETREKIRNYTISSNDVYISIAGTIGLAGLIPLELNGANLTENAAKLCDLKEAKKELLAYLLNSDVLKRQIIGLTGKGTQPKFALFRIESLKLPLPSLKEQERIAEVLGVVDSAIGLVDEVIAKTERLKKGLMQELLTKGIGHTEYKDTPIGKIPKTWDIVRLGDISEVVSGFGFPLDFQGRKTGKYPFIKVGDMNSFEKYVTSANNFVEQEDIKALKAKTFPPNTIIFPKIGMAIYLNKFRIVKAWSTFDNNVAGVTLKKGEPEFLYYYFLGKVDLKRLSNRTTAPSIRKSTLESLQLPFPPLSEQQRIADILSTIDKKIQLEKNEKTRLGRAKRGLMDLLLTGKVRVKVD